MAGSTNAYANRANEFDTASPNGPIGAVKESMAITRLILESNKQSSTNELVGSVLSDLMTAEGRKAASMMDLLGKKPDEIKQLALANLTQSKALVSAKSGTDAEAWGAWLSEVAKRVSEAATEGGFFGFGGTLVNDAEKTALVDIGKALSQA